MRHRKLGLGGFVAVLLLFAGMLLALISVVLLTGRAQTTVSFGKTYYFVVRVCEDSTAAAVVGEVYSGGGAGLRTEDGVVVACYYLRSDAERVSASMEERGISTRLLEKRTEDVVLTGDEAEMAARVQANAELADVCAKMLFDAANGLERGSLSQEGARAMTKGAANALHGLRLGNAEAFFADWDRALEGFERECEVLSSGILFAKDLRRLQADILSHLVNFSSYL